MGFGKKYGIIAAGIGYQYAKEAVKELFEQNKISILKIGYFNPLPEKFIKDFLREIEEVLFVEELEPFLEERIKAIAADLGKGIKFFGKLNQCLPETGALCVDHIRKAILKIWEFTHKEIIGIGEVEDIPDDLKNLTSRQANIFCPGCPHRASLFILKQSIKRTGEDFVVTNDIGCYLLGVKKPFSLADTVFCMGASIGIASGLYRAKIKQRIIAIIGDSTFLHTGITALINCCYTEVDILIFIMDNRTIAMTGLQPYPGTGMDAKGIFTKAVSLEEIAKACKVDYLAVIDPFKISKAKGILLRALRMKGQRVIISRHECAQMIKRKKSNNMKICRIDFRKCKQCKLCVDVLACPALTVRKNTVVINYLTCRGCGLCMLICPYGAIRAWKRR